MLGDGGASLFTFFQLKAVLPVYNPAVTVSLPLPKHINIIDYFQLSDVGLRCLVYIFKEILNATVIKTVISQL